MIRRAVDPVLEEMGKEYGVDYVDAGFKPGGLAVILGMGRDIHKVYGNQDARGNALSALPMMRGVKTYDDIALMTDFGMQDYYVGAMKGMILQINPKATLVDVSHDIESQNLYHGAFVLRQGWPCFPAGSTSVVVIDSGVAFFGISNPMQPVAGLPTAWRRSPAEKPPPQSPSAMIRMPEIFPSLVCSVVMAAVFAASGFPTKFFFMSACG